MDTYITQYEAIGYGGFAAQQMIALLKGIDPDFDPAVDTMSKRVTGATEILRAALQKADGVEITTYVGAAGADDPLAGARAVLKRVVKYAESRAGGESIVRAILHGETLTAVLRLRPAKLLPALDHAIAAVAQHQGDLPEHQAWTDALTKAKNALAALDSAVRKSRVERRAMTPEVQAARESWLKVYDAAKLFCEGLLLLQDKERLLPEVFDDLAEIHRVPGASDGDKPTPQPIG
ncbi:Hypothetical protein A7982_09651 [Minicystis rosea]|nr:Hypothetical protein A7982_09651 [Minicystis rosea]